jgi:hypothetical protein
MLWMDISRYFSIEDLETEYFNKTSKVLNRKKLKYNVHVFSILKLPHI